MAEEKLNLLIVTPQKVYKNTKVDSLGVTTDLGQITILPHHEELLANVAISILIIKEADKEKHYAVGGGAMHFKAKDNQAVLVLHSIEAVEEIDENKVLKEKQEAEMKLKVQTSYEEHREAELSLLRSLNMLAAKQTYKD